MPKEGIINKPHKEILTFEEIVRLVKIFASLGIRKIRLTGGEPLARRGLARLIKSLAEMRTLEEVCLTTNGALLARHAKELKQTGLKRINISLDTLKEDKFKRITRSNLFREVISGIGAAKEQGFSPIKLNTVVMKGINDGEIIDFVDFAISKGLFLRFIEFMKVTPLWREDYYISAEEIRNVCKRKFGMKRLDITDSSPAEYYEIDRGGILGFIKTNEDYCKKCTRLRLASTGELRICLYENKGVSLKELLRSSHSDEEIKDVIASKTWTKQYADYNDYEFSRLYMCNIGG